MFPNLPAPPSLAEERRKTAFFGVPPPPIKCTAVSLSQQEIELFRKNVRGTLQGAIRLTG